MKHKITDKQHLDSHNWRVTVQLIPENEAEIKAIQNTEIVEATDSERELIDTYLNFNLGLGNYSVVSFISQNKSTFIIKVFQN
jgi:hypothetical protein